ncbi:ribonuclease HII [Patescibacteria group bacterium]|nr:ribonuclease HII [Patescibacteria group bacterium]
MQTPNRIYENKLKRKGFLNIVGIDEAGRGAWAGPIVAGAIILPKRLTSKIKINDSKKLTAKQRQTSYDWLIKNSLSWSVASVSQETIDKIGIQKSNILAFKTAVKNLKIIPDYILVDAINFKYKKYQVEPIIKGDQKIVSIAAASIIAKVYRDNLLKMFHNKHPQYGFDRHKGYGTKKHYDMICKNGICKLHRKSYHPIKGFM